MKTPPVLLGLVMATVFSAESESGFAPGGGFAQQNSGAVQSAEKLPPDVNPNSLSRMPRAKREDFATEEERQAFDRLLGPEGSQFNVQSGAIGGTLTRIHLRPAIADTYRTLVRELRARSGTDVRYQELAILVASRETNNKTEWVAHEDNTLKAGVSREIIEMIRNKKDLKGLAEKDATLIQFGRELFRDPKVSSKTFADMERLFGRKSTLALTLIMGYYEASASLLRAYDQHLNPGERAFP